MTCRNCFARLTGNRFIRVQAILLVPLMAMFVCLMFLLLFIIDKSVVAIVVLGVLGSLSLVVFIVGYVLATLRWGRYRLVV